MSAAQASAVRLPRPAGGSPAGAPRPWPQQAAPARLRVVRAPTQARTRVPFVLTCMSALAASLLGALLLNTSMAQGEYERQGLQSRLSESTQAVQSIEGQLEAASSPANLAAAARGLGMVLVPASQGGYLRLADGAVLGNPTPAGAGG